MTTPFTYPPGTISTWGTKQALANQSTWISYIGVDGTIFYLSGPLAPVAGAQDGLVLQKFMGLMSAFDHLELRGARQDGATWTDAVYDVGDIMLSLEASGVAPQNIRDVIRHWISAWDARQTGILSVFTPDMGEWWANVRMGKTISDQFSKDYTWSGKQNFVWTAKNYDAFWYSVDSVGEFDIAYDVESEDFTTQSNASTLGSAWTQFLSVSGHGTYGIENNSAYYLTGGTGAAAVDVVNLYQTNSGSDNQVVTVKLSNAALWNLTRSVNPGTAIDVWARLNSTGTSGIRLRLQLDTFSLAHVNAGVVTTWFTLPLVVPPVWSEEFTLIAGTDAGTHNFQILRDGFKIWEFTDWNHDSLLGSSYRGWGFGVHTVNGGLSTLVPAPIGLWKAADNLTATQTGFLSLTNMGDVPAWPRYLCYGPGTFTFGNPGTSSAITFGPLEDGQIVLIVTEPRLRNIVDLTPGQPAQPLTKVQALMEELISFATNNNTPPLLQQFESLFGILPPQGNLYALLNGRFTNSIPGSAYGAPPSTQQIPLAITNGTPVSKVVGAITPMRRWPL